MTQTTKLKELEKAVEEMEQKVAAVRKKIEKIQEKAMVDVAQQIISKYFGPELLEKVKECAKARAEERWEDFYAIAAETKKILNLSQLKSASDEEKIVVAQYLHRLKIIVGGCGGSFGFYKDPTTCGSCIAAQATIRQLGLEKFMAFLGSREYMMKREALKKAEKYALKVVEAKEFDELEKIQAELDSKLQELKAAKNKMEKFETIAKFLKKDGVELEQVLSEMPEFAEHMVKVLEESNVEFITALPQERVGAWVIHSWSYYGSGGSEYGATVAAWRDGSVKQEYFKYRDPYDPHKDDWRLAFDKVQIAKVTPTTVEVVASSHRGKDGSYSRQITFELPRAKKSTPKLSPEETKEFLRWVEEQEKQLIQRHTRSAGIMPDYVASWGIPAPFATGSMVSYEEATIVDRCIKSQEGRAALVVKAQIDHRAEMGKQYEWCVYVLDWKGKKVERVDRDVAYQLQLRDGKQIRMRAAEYLS